MVEVICRRLAERERQRIVVDAAEARAEFAADKIRKPSSVQDLLREIDS